MRNQNAPPTKTCPTFAIVSLDGHHLPPVTPVVPVTKLSPEQAADEFFPTSSRRCGAQTIREWLRNGVLNGVKIGNRWMVERSELERLYKAGLEVGFISTRSRKSKRRNAARA